MQHLIGGGMSYRLYCEWYRWHGFERPRLMSGLTLFGYHLLNEVVEAENHQGWNVDPVADFYVFNVLGVVVFSSDSVSRFFARTLHMADWSYQPAIDPRDGSIVNNGQNFVWKLDLPWTERWRLFYHWGTHAEGGLSWRVDDEWSLSGGLGLKADELVDLGDGFKTVDLAASAGLFLDRNNSLMASLVMAHTKDYRWRVNLYPGLFDLGPVSPGLFAVDSRTRGAIFGITLDFLPVVPVGLAFSGPADDPTVLSSGW